MAVLDSGDLESIDAMTPERMAKDAGNSAHDVRTWVAAFAALGAAGRYDVSHSFYRPIREYIAPGFGVRTARSTRLRQQGGSYPPPRFAKMLPSPVAAARTADT